MCTASGPKQTLMFLAAPSSQVTPAQLKALEVRLRGINELAVVQHATKAAVEVWGGGGEGGEGAVVQHATKAAVEVWGEGGRGRWCSTRPRQLWRWRGGGGGGDRAAVVSRVRREGQGEAAQ